MTSRTVKRAVAGAGPAARPANSKRPTDIVSRLLTALEFVAQAKEPVTAADLATSLGIPRATAYRVFARLEQEGIVIPEPGGRGFAAGERLSDLAMAALTSSTRHAARHRVLQALVDQVGETCNLTTLTGGDVVYLDRVETHWPLRMHLSRGSRVPAYCTATGKLLLSLLPKPDMEALIRVAPLKRFAENTVTDPDRLIAELARIRAEGIGIDNEEFAAGMVAVAVPVFDRNQRTIAALAVHAPVVRLSLKAARRHVPALRKAAAALSELLS
jgi:IclR family acetate operon transcriptional repressor